MTKGALGLHQHIPTGNIGSHYSYCLLTMAGSTATRRLIEVLNTLRLKRICLRGSDRCTFWPKIATPTGPVLHYFLLLVDQSCLPLIPSMFVRLKWPRESFRHSRRSISMRDRQRTSLPLARLDHDSYGVSSITK